MSVQQIVIVVINHKTLDALRLSNLRDKKRENMWVHVGQIIKAHPTMAAKRPQKPNPGNTL